MGGRSGDGSPPLRVVFVGNAGWSVASLESLAASGHEVARVLTRAPRPAGRGREPAETPVAAAARALELPLLETPTVREGPGFDAIAGARPDVLVVVAYGEILPERVLVLPRLMPVNVHFSLLPALRGAAPVQRAILNGLAETGITTMRMDAGMDTGPILLQRPASIRDDDDAGSLGARLAAEGGALLVETLDALAGQDFPSSRRTTTPRPWLPSSPRRRSGSIGAGPQPRSPAASGRSRPRPAPPRRWAAPGSRSSGSRTPARRGPDAEPGRLRLIDGAPIVATGEGGLRLDEVQAEGRRRMAGGDWARGREDSRGRHPGPIGREFSGLHPAVRFQPIQCRTACPRGAQSSPRRSFRPTSPASQTR